LEIRVLGPLEVERDGQPLDVRGAKRRAVLAMLVLHANEVVRTDRLIEDLWGERRPANAQAALQNHVFRLRRDIGGDVLVTKPWGYVLRIDPEAIDLHRFEVLVAESRSLPARERAARLADALALWRGAALADLAQEEGLAAEIDRLEELRLSALEERIDADLELGGSPELVHELETLVAAHPLRERLRGQLILALYRSGRQAEALETYRETRRVLVEELGIEPSPELKELERAILRQDPSLAVAPAYTQRIDPLPKGSRWRWPRSPLAVAAALALVLAAGALSAVALTREDSGGRTAAPIAPSTSSAVSTDGPSKPKPPPATTTETQTEPPPSTTTVVQPVLTTTTTQPEPPTTSHPQPTRPEPTTNEQTTTTTTTPKPPTTPQPVFDYLLADAFDTPGRDAAMWHLASNGLQAVSAVEQKGRLELSVDPAAVPGGMFFDTHYGTQCRLLADFDARVDFELLSWPSANGILVSLAPWFPGATTVTHIGRSGELATGGFESYGSAIRSTADNQTVQTADLSGSLRAKRVNGRLTTYYRSKDQWVRLASALASGPVNLLIGINANATEFGRQPATVAFDNFTAIAESVDCAGYPLPPRIRRR
jgi:DNA-binding SARP family transcriptional activator